MKPDGTGQGGAPVAEAAHNGTASSLPTRPGATTLGEYAAAWLARLPEAQRPKRATAVRNWIVPFIGGRELATLSESSVEELRARLLGEGFAVRTYWHAKDVLGQIWRAGYAEGLVKQRPPGRVRNAPDVLAERDRPTAAEPTFARPRPSPARPGSLTVMEYAQHWLASRCVPPWMAPSTAGVKGKVVRYYLAQSPLAGVPIDSLTKSMVAEYQRSLFARGLAYTTVLSVIRGTLGPMMAAAVEDGLIPESPAHGLRWPRQPALKPDPFTPEECERIFRWYEDFDAEASLFVGLVFLAGMRPSEAAGLRARDVDARTGQVVIDRALTSGRVGNTKTPASARRIFVGSRLRALLAARIAARRGSDDLLCTQNGRPINTETWGGKSFRRCLEEIGLYRRGRNFYHGRHSYISAAASSGAPVPAIAKFCGTSMHRIERHYLKWLNELRDPLEEARRTRSEGGEA